MARIVALAAALLTLLAVAAAPAGATRYVAGSDGSGDPFFPLAGNGGYDVKHYGCTSSTTSRSTSSKGWR